MLEIDPYRSELNGIVNDLKMTADDILLFARSDLSRDLTGGDTFLFLTKDTLVITEGQIRLDGQHKVSVRRDRLRSVYDKKNVDTYELSGLSELALEELISTARLTGKREDGTVFLAMLTNTAKENIRLFVKYVNQYKRRQRNEGRGRFQKRRLLPRLPQPVSRSEPQGLSQMHGPRQAYKENGNLPQKVPERNLYDPVCPCACQCLGRRRAVLIFKILL